MNADLVYLAKIVKESEQEVESIANDTSNNILNEIISNINDGSYSTLSIPSGVKNIPPSIKDIIASERLFMLYYYLIY